MVRAEKLGALEIFRAQLGEVWLNEERVHLAEERENLAQPAQRADAGDACGAPEIGDEQKGDLSLQRRRLRWGHWAG